MQPTYMSVSCRCATQPSMCLTAKKFQTIKSKCGTLRFPRQNSSACGFCTIKRRRCEQACEKPQKQNVATLLHTWLRGIHQFSKLINRLKRLCVYFYYGANKSSARVPAGLLDNQMQSVFLVYAMCSISGLFHDKVESCLHYLYQWYFHAAYMKMQQNLLVFGYIQFE